MRRIKLDWNEEPDTLYPVPVPEGDPRRRSGGRVRPLTLHLSKEQLIELRASVARAIMAANVMVWGAGRGNRWFMLDV